MNRYEAIVLGVSAGGIQALATITPALPEDYTLPLIVVQHMAKDSDGYLSVYLNDLSPILVKEAEDKEPIRQGTVYVAPPGYHLLIEHDRTLALSVDPLVNCARPAIDVLFESAADVYGRRLIGVILTGGNADGSHGLKRIKDRGGVAVVQDPDTAESACMPQAAIGAVQVDRILKLDEIGPFLKQFHGG